jgi:hypothetical protein
MCFRPQKSVTEVIFNCGLTLKVPKIQCDSFCRIAIFFYIGYSGGPFAAMLYAILTINILNKQSRTVNKEWSSSLGVGRTC